MTTHNSKKKTGILLINLGTPDSPSVKDVRCYLREFLSDPRVIDIPAPARWLILNLFILPFRPKQSAEAYAQIWSEEGSPLLAYSEKTVGKLSAHFDDNVAIELGMRYGNPSIKSAVEKLQQAQCTNIIILPLFPQYSSAATGSAIEEALAHLYKNWNIPSIKIIHEFYQHPAFIKTYAEIIKENLNNFDADLLLLSYHGLPVRHLTKSECNIPSACKNAQECPAISAQNQFCYRAQCYATTRSIVKELNLPAEKYATSFQSRLGRTEWIKPYTDIVLEDYAKQGIKKLAIVCPAFVADCLETLEEIGIRAREQWLQLGGEELKLIPCLNDDERWMHALREIIEG